MKTRAERAIERISDASPFEILTPPTSHRILNATTRSAGVRPPTPLAARSAAPSSVLWVWDNVDTDGVMDDAGVDDLLRMLDVDEDDDILRSATQRWVLLDWVSRNVEDALGHLHGPDGKFIDKIRHLLGAGSPASPESHATGRVVAHGGSVGHFRLRPRPLKIDDRVYNPGDRRQMGTVLAIFPADKTMRVQWDDGRTEVRPLASVTDPIPDPRRRYAAVPPEPVARLGDDMPTRTPTAREKLADKVAAGGLDASTAARLAAGESAVSIVDSRSPEGFRNRERAKLTDADRVAVDAMDPDRQELYWLRRTSGQDHGKAMAGLRAKVPTKRGTDAGLAAPGVGPGTETPLPGPAAAAKKTVTPNPRTKAGRRQLMLDVVDEALREGEKLPGFDEKFLGVGSPRDVLAGLRSDADSGNLPDLQAAQDLLQQMAHRYTFATGAFGESEHTAASRRIGAVFSQAATHIEAAKAAATAPRGATTPHSDRDLTGDVQLAEHALDNEFSADSADGILSAIAARQGFDGKPKVVSRREMDRLVAGGAPELFHGASSAAAPDGTALSAAQVNEQLRTGPAHFGTGTGFLGNGYYLTSSRDVAESDYGDGTPGAVARVIIKPDAKRVPYDLIEAEQRGFLASLPDDDPRRSVYSDVGRFAAAKGYAVIDVPGASQHTDESWHIILDRTALMVESATPTKASPVKATKSAAKKAAPRKANPPVQSPSSIVDRLRSSSSRDEARQLLAGKKVADLKAIAASADIAVGSKYTKPQLIDAIVQWTVGRRLDSDAISPPDPSAISTNG